MISRRNQWFIAAVLLAGLLAYYSMADDGAPDPDSAASPAVAAQPPAAATDAGAAPAAIPVAAAATPQSPAPTALVPVEIRDEDGSLAETLMIPADWQIVGGVRWNDATGCPGLMVQRTWTAIGPDSLTSVAVLPGFNWQHAGTEIPTSACPVAPFRTLRELLQATAGQLHADARILDYEDTTAQHQAELAAAGAQPTVQPPPETEAGRILVAYRDAEGIEMREILSASMNTFRMQGNVVSNVPSIAAQRAPDGRLDPAIGSRILATSKADPQWLTRFQQRSKRNMDRFFSQQRQQIDQWHQRQMAMINARGMADRHAIRMRTNQEVANIYGSIAASNSATSDRMHRRSLEAIGEYNSYSGVGGSTVQSSIHGGDRVFQSTNDPSQAFSTSAPYAAPPAGYVELERQR